MYKKLGFGKRFGKWIEIIYSDVTSCIINNGYTSKYFEIQRGVRQGDPLSPYLFIIVLEFLAQRIRFTKDIKGITFGRHEIKMTMYADDTTLFLANKASIKNLLVILDKFKIASGLQVNIEKTEGLALDENENMKNKFGFKWS